MVFWFVELKEIGDVIGYMAATASETSISLFPPQGILLLFSSTQCPDGNASQTPLQLGVSVSPVF